MTTNRDFDQMARAWLDLMPDEAPDRLIANVRQAVDVTPQERGWRRLAFRRPNQMNRMTLIAATAVVALALVGGAMLLVSGHPGPTTVPATASPAPTNAPAGGTLPDELIGDWFGGPKPLDGLAAGAGTMLVFRHGTPGADVVQVVQSNQQDRALLGAFGSGSGGHLALRTGDGPALCFRPDVGEYTYAVSSSGQTLTISDSQDPCTGRQAALFGTWWRADCKVGQATCLGLMDAGTYATQYLRPQLIEQPWAPKYGGLTFTVPAGYANDADWPTSFSISRAAAFQASDTGEGSPRLMVLTQVSASAQGKDRCSATAATGVPPNPTALIAYLRTIPGLRVSAATDFPVGGAAGTWVDVSVDAAKLVACPSGDKIVEFMRFGNEGYGLGTDGVDRVIFVTLGGNDLVAISAEAPDQASLDAWWAEMLPIIQSFQFE